MAYFQVRFSDAVNNLERVYIVKAESLREVNGIMCVYLPDVGDFEIRSVKLFLEVEPKVTCEIHDGGYICRMYACTLDGKSNHSEADLCLLVDASSEEDARTLVLDHLRNNTPLKIPEGISGVEKRIIGFIK
nr:MAG TPA: protein of unknown function (DUF4494) [Caudoviricetes sp.]